MIRLRNVHTGLVVVASDEATATRLGGGYEPVTPVASKPAAKKAAPAKPEK